MPSMRWRRRWCRCRRPSPRLRPNRRRGASAPRPEAPMRKLSLIFPMAGQGARFGYRFKPFLDVQGKSFIEAAFAPFREGLPQIDKVDFIVTAEQERTHG